MSVHKIRQSGVYIDDNGRRVVVAPRWWLGPLVRTLRALHLADFTPMWLDLAIIRYGTYYRRLGHIPPRPMPTKPPETQQSKRRGSYRPLPTRPQ